LEVVTVSRSRAYRRHKRHVKLQRRYRLMAALVDFWPAPGPVEDHGDRPPSWRTPNPRWMHFHLNCSCWDIETAGERRRREERAWRASEE
jgi:hypothetical protein